MSWRRTHIHRRRWRKVRLQVFRRDGYRCQRCGKAGRLECHHITPLKDGGEPYALENIETICRDCHIRHHQGPVDPERERWRALVQELLGE